LPLVQEERVSSIQRPLPRTALLVVPIIFVLLITTMLYLSPVPITFGTWLKLSGPRASVAIVARLTDYGVVGTAWKRDSIGHLYLSDPFYYGRRGTFLGVHWFKGNDEDASFPQTFTRKW
jgi:hypothetical protein